MKSSNARKKPDGFVLLEVLISAVVLSIGCLLLAETLQGSLRAMWRVQESYEAGLNAGNVLWMLDRTHESSPQQTLLTPGSLQGLTMSLNSKTLDDPKLSDALDVKTVLMQWQSARQGAGSFELSGYYSHENPQTH